MLKKTITYEDFEGESNTEDFYFHLSKTELIAMDVEHQEGFEKWINGIIKSKDNKTLYDLFKKMVLASYGEKSLDGKSFKKTPEIAEAFSHHAACEVLLMELIMDSNAGAEFITGIVPKDLGKAVGEQARELAKQSSTSETARLAAQQQEAAANG